MYEKALAASIIQLKAQPHIPRKLRVLIAEAVELQAFRGADLVMPTPLSKLRRAERGFNQAELIGGIVADRIGAKLDSKSLRRTAHTPIHRVGMDQRARELTVQNAFEVVRPKLIEGRRILLVDDVLTSGATASFCAKALKRSGAEAVDVFTLARAVMK